MQSSWTAGVARGVSSAGPFPTDSTAGPPDRGRQLFVGGPVGSDTLTQTDSLAFAALTLNDRFATPLNGFWPARR